jgi:hypothetical protein
MARNRLSRHCRREVSWVALAINGELNFGCLCFALSVDFVILGLRGMAPWTQQKWGVRRERQVGRSARTTTRFGG